MQNPEALGRAGGARRSAGRRARWLGALRAVLRFPSYGDPVAQHDAETSEFVAFVFAFGGSLVFLALLTLRAFGVPEWSDAPTLHILAVNAVGTLLLIPAVLALRAGRVRLANLAMVWLAYAGATAATWFGAELPNPGLLAYVVVLVAAGVLVPGRVAVAVCVVCGLTIAGMAIWRGVVPSGVSEAPETVYANVPALVAIGAIISAILIRSSQRARVAIAQAVEQQEVLERQNRELRAHEARFRGIVDHTRELVAEIDAAGRIVYASPNHVEVTGRTPSEHLGRYAWEFIHPDDLARRAGEYPAPGRPAEPFRVRTSDGSWRWLEMAVTPFQSAEGEQRVLAITRDVTTRVAAEALEAQRRAAASHAQKMEALGRLAGGITHELNNLMTVITLNVELLDDQEQLPRDAFVPLAHIQESAEQATTLTRRLLGFARPAEASEDSLEADAHIRDLARLLRPLVGESVALDLDLAAGGSHVEVDRTELAQLLMNLVVNARAAVEDAGTVAISTRDVEFLAPHQCHSAALPPGRYVGLCVSDTGSGMDEETQARIFDPFFTTWEENGGTGLGLTLVYGIVRRAGGDLSVESAPGAGSRFEAFLPRVAPPDVAARDEAPAIAVGGRETVLVVEDQSGVRLAMARVVRSLGYRVLEASCGERALELEKALDEPLHLLLTDVVMPRMQGPELAQRLLQRRPEMRVLYLTGYAGRAFPAGTGPDHDVLYKPAGRDVLAARLRAVLDAPVSHAPPDELAPPTAHPIAH